MDKFKAQSTMDIRHRTKTKQQ